MPNGSPYPNTPIGNYHDFLRKKYMLGDESRNAPVGTGGTSQSAIGPNLTARSTPNTFLPAATADKGIGGPGVFSRMFSKDKMQTLGNKVSTGVTAASPYISNLMNSIRTPPKPSQPHLNPFVTLSKVNLDNERQMVRAGTAASNRATDRNVDANTGEAVKQFAKGQEFERLSSISERESNANVGIGNQQAQLDLGVTMGNNAKKDEYDQSLTARDIASQREKSANVANLGDKIVAIKNEKDKGRIELAKANVLKSVYARSGVLTRSNSVAQAWKDAGLDDPFGKNYSDLETTQSESEAQKNKKALGGRLIKYGPGGKLAPEPTYRFPADANPGWSDSVLYKNSVNRAFSNPGAYSNTFVTPTASNMANAYPDKGKMKGYADRLQVYTNAQEDASNVMSDQQVHQELNTLYVPGDLKKRAMGGKMARIPGRKVC